MNARFKILGYKGLVLVINCHVFYSRITKTPVFFQRRVAKRQTIAMVASLLLISGRMVLLASSNSNEFQISCDEDGRLSSLSTNLWVR